MKIKPISTAAIANTPIDTVLINRGCNPDGFFDLSWHNIQDPSFLDNIEAGVKMFLDHVQNKRKIAIIVDSDVDGFTSAAILSNWLHAYENFSKRDHLEITYFFHEGKTHGLDNAKIMKQVLALKPALLIIPDASGSTNQYLELNTAGIDVLVLDHHHTPIATGNANGFSTVVINNQHSENYQNKSLSGAGVVYQFCVALDHEIGVRSAETWLDLVALGLVADVMDLREPETRFLVQIGLANPSNQFILQTLETNDYSMQGKLTPHTVAFYVAPMINAVNRIGTQEEKKLLFEAMLDSKTQTPIPSGKRGAKGEMVPLVMEALRQGANAKSRQTRRQDKLAQLIDNVIEEEALLENKVIIVTIDDFDADQRALAGLVANKMIDLYQRPVMLMYFNEETENWQGSCRAPSDVEAFADFRQQCEDSELFVYASGHAQAFGVSCLADKIEEIQEHFNDLYASVNVEPTLYCDFIFDANDPALVDTILELGQYDHVWGHGIKEPLIAVNNVTLSKTNTVLFTRGRVPTLKISLPNEAAVIKFNSSQEEFNSLLLPYDGGVEQCRTATIVGRSQINEWQGKVTAQLKLVDYNIEGVKYVF